MALDETSANKPFRVVTDNTRVDAHPLDQQIELDRYLAAKRAATANNGRIWYTNVASPPGATSRLRSRGYTC